MKLSRMSEWVCQSFGFFGVATQFFQERRGKQFSSEELAYIFEMQILKREIKIGLSKANKS